MTTATNAPEAKSDEKMVHPWERSGFGRAPFEVTGFSESERDGKASATCDVCGTGIRNVCHIRSADGRSFKVGSDCVRKTEDARLVPAVDSHERIAQRNKRLDREVTKVRAVDDAVAATLARPEVKAELVKHPHPYAIQAAKGKTMWDWADSLFKNGFAADRKRVGQALAEMGLT